VLVTGGSRGIGRAIALKFARNGYNVAITSTSLPGERRSLETAVKLDASECRFITLEADFLQSGAIERVFSEFDRHYNHLDVLVNNAGWTQYIAHRNLDELSEELFDKIITIDLKSVFLCIQQAVRRMQGDDCCIVNISSIAAYNGMGSNIAYCAAKAGVNSMTKSLACALGPRIRVNGVAPGLTDTEMTRSGPDSYREEQVRVTPLGRIAVPEDIADVAFALAHEMKFVNGKSIIVDGGRLL